MKFLEKLYFDVIPKNVDEHSKYVNNFAKEDIENKLKNPAWHIHNGNIPNNNTEISYSMMLNLASVCNADSPEILWGFISKYSKNDKLDPWMKNLINKSLNYYKDFVEPHKKYRRPNKNETLALESLIIRLSKLKNNSPEELIQSEVYEVGKEFKYIELREWFTTLYETLLGQKQGPRIGTFISIYGCDKTIELIKMSINGELVN